MLNIDINYKSDTVCTLDVSGSLKKENIKKIYPIIKKLKQKNISFMEINCLNVKSLDNSGALLLADLIAHFSQRKASITLKNLDDSFKSILIFARKNLRQKPKIQKSKDSPFILYDRENYAFRCRPH